MTRRARAFGGVAALSILFSAVLFLKLGISHRVDVAKPHEVQNILSGQDLWFLPDGSIRSSYQRGSCVVLSHWTQGASLSQWSGTYKVFDLSRPDPWEGSGAADDLPISPFPGCKASGEPVWAVDPHGRYLAVFSPGEGLRVTIMPEGENAGLAESAQQHTTELLELGDQRVIDLAITSTGVGLLLFDDGVVELWDLHEGTKGIAGTQLGPDWKFIDRKGKLVLAASDVAKALNGIIVEGPDRMDQWSRVYPALDRFGWAGISAPGCFGGGAPDSGALTLICLSYLWEDGHRGVGRFADAVHVGTFAVPPGSEEFVVYNRERIIVGGLYPGLYLSKEGIPLRKMATPQEKTLALALRGDLLAVQSPGKLTVLQLEPTVVLNRGGSLLAWVLPFFLSLLALILAMLQDR